MGYVPTDDLFAQLGLGIGKIFYDSDRMDDAIRQFQTVIERHPVRGQLPKPFSCEVSPNTSTPTMRKRCDGPTMP